MSQSFTENANKIVGMAVASSLHNSTLNTGIVLNNITILTIIKVFRSWQYLTVDRGIYHWIQSLKGNDGHLQL